jgi:membrane-associated protease RseP (regulator of RpoE activity)
VIELARYYAKNDIKEQHNFLFLCFSGEELGLFGSKKYVERPTIDLSTVSFMLNMDMIGRLNAEKRIMVGGVGTAPDFVPLMNSLKGNLNMRLDSAGSGPSDHTSFYQKNLPVLFFFTGQHSDYHKPGDDIAKINFEGEIMVLDLAIRALAELDKKPKLVFQETKSNQSTGVSFKVTLGIMPDYTYEGTGVRIDGVTDGKPAAKAGIQKGDIIMGMGDVPINTIQDYMKSLSTFKKGDNTTVKVRRGAEDVVVNATF